MFDLDLMNEESIFAFLANRRRQKRRLARLLRHGHWLDRHFAIVSVEELFQITLRESTSPFGSIHSLGLAYAHHHNDFGQLTALGRQTLHARMPYFETAQQIGRFKLNLDQEYVIFSVYEMARYVAWKFRCQEAAA